MPLTGYTIIYGGSFNPPHFGHAATCLWLMKCLNAYKVDVVPTYQHAFNKSLAPFIDRVVMCELMSAPWRNSEVGVSQIEKYMPSPNLTINLVKSYLNTTDKVAVAIGSDLLGEIDRWAKWDEVAELAKIVVVGRQGSEVSECKYPVINFPIHMPSISSTEIRNRIAERKDITGLVPVSVADYINHIGLYKED